MKIMLYPITLADYSDIRDFLNEKYKDFAADELESALDSECSWGHNSHSTISMGGFCDAIREAHDETLGDEICVELTKHLPHTTYINMEA